MDRRLALYDLIDADMGSLEGYRPGGCTGPHRILEVVPDVLARRLINDEGWLAKGPIERLVVHVSDVVCWAAGTEAADKRRAAHELGYS